MPRFKVVYGWKDGDRFFASLLPKGSGTAANVYTSPNDLMQDAADRGLTVQWDNPDEIDKWQAR